MGFDIRDFLNGTCPFRLVPATQAAIDDVHALLKRSARTDGGTAPPVDRLRAMFRAFGRSLPDLSRIARDPEGRLIGLALLFPPSAGEDTVQLLWDIDPQARDGALAAALLIWSKDRAGSLAPGLRGLRSSFDTAHAWRRQSLERNGFTLLSRSWRLEKPISAPGEGSLQEDIHLIPWADERSAEALDVFLASFANHPRVAGVSATAWRQRLIEVPQFRPDLSFLAVQTGCIVGLALNWEQPQSMAWIEAFGVRPSSRGQGIGRALLSRSEQAFADAGFGRIGLDVDPDASAAALRLYEQSGFRAVKRTETFLHLV